MHINTLRIGRLGISAYMYPEGEYKNVNWALFGKSLRLEQTPTSLRACSKRKSPRPRIILSRTLKFKLTIHNIDDALVGVT